MRCPRCGNKVEVPGVPLTKTQRNLFDILRSRRAPVKNGEALNRLLFGDLPITESCARVHRYRLNKRLEGTGYYVTEKPYSLRRPVKKKNSQLG